MFTLKIFFLKSLFFFTIVQQTFSQTFISNDSVKFSVLRKSSVFIGKGKIEPAVYRIKVHIADTLLNECLNFSKEKWIKLLSDDKADWAANLILYQIHKRNAVSFLASPDMRYWKLRKKKFEINYWKKYFYPQL
jgi:hypothetical protein